MDKDLMMALLAAAQKAAQQGTDADFKAMAADLAGQLSERAKALGVDGAGAGGEQAPPSESAEAQAKRAAAKCASEGTSGGDAAAVVKSEDSRPVAAGRGVSLADVKAIMREEKAKESLIASAKDRPGMTEKLVELLGGKSLAEAREIIGALPAAPNGAGTGIKTTELTAGAANAAPAAAGLTLEEQHDVKLLDRMLGTDPEKLVASRAAAAKGEAGVISFKRLEKLRLAPKNGGTAAS